MLSLLLAIASSAMVSIMMRLGESKPTGKMSLLLFNYSACTLLGLIFTLSGGLQVTPQGAPFALGLGIASGFLFLGSLMMMQKNIAVNGVVMTATFMKMGVLVPTITAIVCFGESPRVTQLLGIALALCAILMLNLRKDAAAAVKGKWLLILLLLVGGLTDTTTNIFDKMGNPAWKDGFLVLIFFTAFLLTLILVVRSKEPITRWDVLCGLGVGIPNYFSSRFTLDALKTVPAVVVYPVYSVATIVVITLAGKFFFHETLDRRKYAALAVIFAALVLLNI